MAQYETTPNPVARVGVADVFSSAALDTREDSVNHSARQVVVSSSSIPSIDRSMIGPRHHLLWLVRRARVSLAHASALAEANSFGRA